MQAFVEFNHSKIIATAEDAAELLKIIGRSRGVDRKYVSGGGYTYKDATIEVNATLIPDIDWDTKESNL